MATSGRRILPISAGSMSACTIWACGAKNCRLPVTRSSNRAPERDDHVGLLQRGHGRVHAVHARHAQGQRVRVRERAAGHQRGRDRRLGQLGQPEQLGVALDLITPPPTYSTGRRAACSSRAAAVIAGRLGGPGIR